MSEASAYMGNAASVGLINTGHAACVEVMAMNLRALDIDRRSLLQRSCLYRSGMNRCVLCVDARISSLGAGHDACATISVGCAAMAILRRVMMRAGHTAGPRILMRLGVRYSEPRDISGRDDDGAQDTAGREMRRCAGCGAQSNSGTRILRVAGNDGRGIIAGRET